MSRCSGFPEAFVHAALFCCPAYTVFGSPSPGREREDMTRRNDKAQHTHERQWPGCNLALYSGCITSCIFRGLLSGMSCINRRLWRFCEVCGPEALFLWPAHRCSYSRVQANKRKMFSGCESASPVFCKM